MGVGAFAVIVTGKVAQLITVICVVLVTEKKFAEGHGQIVSIRLSSRVDRGNLTPSPTIFTPTVNQGKVEGSVSL